jgi:hypothetical protein
MLGTTSDWTTLIFVVLLSFPKKLISPLFHTSSKRFNITCSFLSVLHLTCWLEKGRKKTSFIFSNRKAISEISPQKWIQKEAY